MAWILLFIAGLLETLWATTMKASDGFTILWPSVVTIVTMLGSFFLLSVAMKSLPLGTSYMVWTGIGALGAFITGIVFYDEAVNVTRVIAAALILLGMALMKTSGP